jgi:chromosome segregation ATPase
MDKETERSGSLEKRNISVETPIDENVLTSSTASAVRFRAAKVPGSSKTYGYVFKEVEKFIEDIVIPSLDWYQSALHERDKTVHYLGEELDKAETDNVNLQRQIQYIEYNGQIKQGIDAGSDDREMAALMSRLQESEKLVTTLQSQLGENGVSPATSEGVDDYEAAIKERDSYIEQITNQYNELYEQYEKDIAELQSKIDNASLTDNNDELSKLLAEKESRIEELETEIKNVPAVVAVSETVDPAHVTELEGYIEQITNQYNELYAQYEKDTSELRARITELEELQSTVVDNGNNSDDSTRIVELESYIEQITNQYNELYAQYEKDIVNVAPTSSGNEAELEQYIEQITNQYNELYAQYQELEANQTPSTNNAELGALKVELEAEKAKTSRLEAELAQYQEVEEEIEDNKPRIPLLTEQKNQKLENIPKSIDVNKLPNGIRADDLF